MRREAIRNTVKKREHQRGDSRRPGDVAIDSRHQHERLTRIEVKQADEDLGEINGQKWAQGNNLERKGDYKGNRVFRYGGTRSCDLRPPEK